MGKDYFLSTVHNKTKENKKRIKEKIIQLTHYIRTLSKSRYVKSTFWGLFVLKMLMLHQNLGIVKKFPWLNVITFLEYYEDLAT